MAPDTGEMPRQRNSFGRGLSMGEFLAPSLSQCPWQLEEISLMLTCTENQEHLSRLLLWTHIGLTLKTPGRHLEWGPGTDAGGEQ